MSTLPNQAPDITPTQARAIAEDAMQAAFAVLCERLDPDARHDLGGFFGYHCEPLSDRIEADLLNAIELAMKGAFPAQTPATLIPCVSYLREIIRKEDANGLCIFDDVKEWTMGELTASLTGCFESFVVDHRDAGNPWDMAAIERASQAGEADAHPSRFIDRFNALAVIERAEYFGPEIYAETFKELAPYVLRNIHPEDVA